MCIFLLHRPYVISTYTTYCYRISWWTVYEKTDMWELIYEIGYMMKIFIWEFVLLGIILVEKPSYDEKPSNKKKKKLLQPPPSPSPFCPTARRCSPPWLPPSWSTLGSGFWKEKRKKKQITYYNVNPCNF